TLISITITVVHLCISNVTSPTEIYLLSLHDALPIWRLPRQRQARRAQAAGHDAGRRHGPRRPRAVPVAGAQPREGGRRGGAGPQDRKSTRLNSSHGSISYAVFCLKKKNNNRILIIYL